MAKTTATIFGLVLAAVSIGLNTARYPIVWRMVDPTLASAKSDKSPPTVQPANPSPSAVPEKPLLSVPPAARSEVKPALEVTDEIVVDAPLPDETSPTGPRTMTEKPLVPVVFAGLSGVEASGTVGRAAVRRLPPVVRDGPIPAGADALRSFGGSIPIYPTTGIE